MIVVLILVCNCLGLKFGYLGDLCVCVICVGFVICCSDRGFEFGVG